MLAVVEARREDLTAGVAQCIAKMYAAALFNTRDGEPHETICGTMTGGTNWRFLHHMTL